MAENDESKVPESDDEGQTNDHLRDLFKQYYAGKDFDPEEYLTRYPDLKDEVHWLLNVLSTRMVEKINLSAKTDDYHDTESDSDDSRTIGDFKIIREIGKGGMGTVYEAKQISLNRKVALKLLPSHLSFSDAAVLKFRREAEAGGRQHHPGIVAIYAVGEEKGVHFIAQELVEGGRTLADELIEYHRQPELRGSYYIEITKLFIEIADALQHAHESKVVHRDLKPSNILITPDGSPKVTDFGIAKIEDALALSRTGDFAGTPFYMSPEQAMSRRIGVDHRTDIFSLGATLYEAITFNRAFDGDTSQQVLEKITLVDPPDPRRIRSRIPRDIAAICLKALEKRRERRYQSMKEFAADLRRFLNNEAIIAKPPGPMQLAIKWTKRYPVISTSGAVAAVAFVAMVFLWWRAEEQRTRAVVAELAIAAERDRSVKAKEEAIKAEKEVKKQYDEIIRLADVKHLSNLEEKAEELWPAYPKNIDGLRSWVDLAEGLVDRLEGHRAALDTLRQRALPYTEEARIRDREDHPKWKELSDARNTKEKLSGRIAALEISAAASTPKTAESDGSQTASEMLDGLKKQLTELEKRIFNLETMVSKRRTFEFSNIKDQWHHDTLVDLVSPIEQLMGQDEGISRSIRKRLEFAETIEFESITKYKDDWNEAIASIADEEECPMYGGLAIEPQIGFVPIGRDPRSGFWEFAHMQTGDIPERDADKNLMLTEEIGLVFVLIPGGTFNMGAVPPSDKYPLGSPNVDPQAAPVEGPIREVTISSFFMSKYETTQGQWLRFNGRNPSVYRPGVSTGGQLFTLLHPVECVSWADCIELARRLNLRLPSEAEWEYACRAGTTTIWWTGDEIKSLEGTANLSDRFLKTRGGRPESAYEECLDDGFACHAPVGSLLPNAFGLHDICGNVFEWCQDTFGYYKNAPTDGSAYIDSGYEYRVFRGGCWFDCARRCRSADRDGNKLTGRNGYLGFRLAFSPLPSDDE